MILATRRGDRELRTSSLAGFGIEPRVGTVGAAMTVNATTAAGIPAVTAAIRLRAEAVASLDLGVWRGLGIDRKRVDGTYPAPLFAGRPNDQQSGPEFWEAVEESECYRGNSYVWLNVDRGKVVEWFALHPDQVVPIQLRSGRRTYFVLVAPWFIDPTGKGDGYYEVGSETILHIKGFGDGGRWIAPSPIERMRLALAAAGTKIEHENSLYARSAQPGLVVSFPGELDKEHLDSYRESFDQLYGGSGNAGRTGVLGGGATVQQVGLTLADAQFVESMHFDVEQIARIFGVRASLLDMGSSGRSAASPLTPEHERTRFLTYDLSPALRRIEGSIASHPALFSSPATYPMFDMQGSLRGDLATEANISLTKVQSGQWLVDEARALDGLPPLPDGAGQIPQVVPVGGGANPVPSTTYPPPPAD